MKRSLSACLAFACWTTLAAAAPEAGWQPLFDGKTLDGWKSNEETKGCFSVEEGAIKISGGRAHLFYVGADGKASFRNFEFRCKAKTTPGSNSGIFFHTQWADKGWPSGGYEAQVNSTHSDRRKTASLYAVRDVMDNAPSKDGEWFDYSIKVEGKRIVLSVNGKVLVDYTEEGEPQGAGTSPGRRLSSGTFALQAHDPKSTTFFKDIAIKTLP